MSQVLKGLPKQQYSLVVSDYSTRNEFAANADRAMPAASIIKLLIALSVVQRNPTAFKDSTVVKTRVLVAASSVISKPLKRIPVAELLRLMIVKSDNVAANALIDYAGHSNIRATALHLGLHSTELDGYFRDTAGLIHRARTSARDVQTILFWLIRTARTTASIHQQNALQILNLMTQQEDRRLIEAGLPNAITVANKTGQVSGVLNDASVIDPYGTGPVLATFLNAGVLDLNTTMQSFVRVGYVIFDHLYASLLNARP